MATRLTNYTKIEECDHCGGTGKNDQSNTCYHCDGYGKLKKYYTKEEGYSYDFCSSDDGADKRMKVARGQVYINRKRVTRTEPYKGKEEKKGLLEWLFSWKYGQITIKKYLTSIFLWLYKNCLFLISFLWIWQN